MSKIFKFIQNPALYLIIIIIIAFAVRLYKIDNPIADWHSWRQADTAAVSRNFYQEGFNPFFPRGDDMSVVSAIRLLNLERYRFVEFPIYNSLVYFSYLLNGGVDERLARLVSVIFSLGSLVFIYFIAKRYWSETTALVAALLFAILPFSIFYSRVVLPEPSLIFFCLGMFYFTDRWIFENSKQLFLISVLFGICAFLTKPMAIFYLLPLGYSLLVKENFKLWPIPWRYIVWLFIVLLPFAGWRLWMSQYPEGIPASSWLLNGNGIRFRPAFWKWIIGDRFGREILGVPGCILFFIGLVLSPRIKEGLLLHLLALSSFLYLIVFATGNVQHDYYQAIIIPAIVLFTARGFMLLIQGVDNFIPRIWLIPTALLFFVLTIYFGWYEIKGLYQINNPVIIEAGKEADRILPQDAIVLAPYQADTAFLYHINRSGFPIVSFDVQLYIHDHHVTHYISTTKDPFTAQLMKKYTVLEDKDGYVIIDLLHEK